MSVLDDLRANYENDLMVEKAAKVVREQSESALNAEALRVEIERLASLGVKVGDKVTATWREWGGRVVTVPAILVSVHAQRGAIFHSFNKVKKGGTASVFSLNTYGKVEITKC